MANEALMRKQTVIAVKETTRGTLEFPATDGSAVALLATDHVTINQDAPLSDNPEIENSRDVLDRIVGRRNPGNWAVPLLLRPSGTAGDVPQADVLWECFLGTKTVTGGTSVAYSQALTKDSFSLWVQKDHAVFFASGCAATQLGVNPTGEGAVALEFSGEFMKMGWAGESTLNGAAAAADTEITGADAKRFAVGGRIENTTSSDDNSGAGYEITAVDVSTETLTISPGVGVSGGWSDGDTIKGFMPSTTTVGEVVESRDTTVDFGSETDKALQNLNLTINDPVMFLEELGTTEPEGYIEDLRDISGSVDVYLRKSDLQYFYDALNDTELAVTLNFGDTAGSQVAISMPQTSISVPQISGNSPAVNANIPIKAVGSSGEDSLTVTFT